MTVTTAGDDSYVIPTLERFRNKLLDLSSNNKLLNLKLTNQNANQYLRFVDCNLQAVLDGLTSGREYRIGALSEPPDDLAPEPDHAALEAALEQARSEDSHYQQLLAESQNDESKEAELAVADERLRITVREELSKTARQDRSPGVLAHWAQRQGLNPSFSLSSSDDDQSHQGPLTTLMPTPRMERVAEAIRRTAKSSLDETGNNILYLAFGCLEWSDRKGKNLLAPLILLPVELRRAAEGSGSRTFRLNAADDTPLTNIALRERLRRDFGIELPTPEARNGKIGLDDYFHSVAESVSEVNAWKVHPFLTLALLNFNGIELYEDLIPEVIQNSVLVRQLLAAEVSDNGQPIEVASIRDDAQVDRPEIAERVPVLIAQADASQFAAVADVMAGHSMVIEGPPGTGKSQTITNIIANALYAGKRVLFVAEKKVALDVVHNRLSDAGLKPYCLRLESDRAHKREVYGELAERLALTRPSAPSREGPLGMFNGLRDDLNAFTELLNTPREPEGQSRHDLLWQELQIRRELEKVGLAPEAVAVELPVSAALGRSAQDTNLQVIEQLASLLDGLDVDGMEQLFAGITLLPADGFALDALLDQARCWRDDLEQLVEALESVEPGVDRSPAQLRQAAVQVAAMAERLPEPLQSEAEALLPALSSPPVAEATRSLLDALREEQETASALMTHFERLPDPLPEEQGIAGLVTGLQQWQFDQMRIPAEPHERGALQESLRLVLQQVERLELLLKAQQGPLPLAKWSTAELDRIQPLLSRLCALPDWVLAQRQTALWRSDPSRALALISEHQQLEELGKILNIEQTRSEFLEQQAHRTALSALQRCVQNGLGPLLEQPDGTERRREQLESLSSLLPTLTNELAALLSGIDLSVVTLKHLQSLSTQVRAVVALGSDVLAHRGSALWDASITEIRAAVAEERDLVARETQLRNDRLTVPANCSADELRQAAQELDARSFFSRVGGYLGGRRVRAKGLCRRIGAGASRCDDLRAVAKVVELRQRYPQGWQRQRFGVDLRSGDLLNIAQDLQRWKAAAVADDGNSPWLSWIRQAPESALRELKRRFDEGLEGDLNTVALHPLWNGAIGDRTLDDLQTELHRRQAEQADLTAAQPALVWARAAGIHDSEGASTWLEQVLALRERFNRFPEEECDELLRVGLEPEQIKAVIAAAQDIRQGLGDAAIKGLDALVRETPPEALREALSTMEHQLRPLLDELFSTGNLLSAPARQKPIGSLLASLMQAASSYQQLLKQWQETGLRTDVSPASLTAAPWDVARAHRRRASVNERLNQLREHAGPEVADAAPELLEQVLSWIRELRSGSLTQEWQEACLQFGSADFIHRRRSQGQTIAAAMTAEQNSAVAFSTSAGLDVSMAHWAEGRSVEDVPERTLHRWLAGLSEQKELLQIWIRQKQLLERLSADDTRTLIGRLLQERRQAEHWSGIYRWNVARNRLQQQNQAIPELQQLRGDDQVARRERFHQLEDELRTLDRQQVACAIHRDPADLPLGNNQGKKSDFTELALIQNEASKQTRHRPLRHLFHHAGEALRGLKPCWMMPPGTVASLLPREAVEQFDLVIIDEASQMPPERALGLISRARQCVVVGDPKQLPPTSFFKLSTTSDDEEQQGDVDREAVDEESILDLCSKTFRPVRRLKWHYRSRHGSLIAFSNRHFYNSELVVFPSCDRDFAIHRHLVTDSRYRGGVNPPEVQRVCTVVVEQLQRHPERSLGVVAMNEEQACEIAEQLEKLAAHHQELRRRLDEQNNSEELFVKALEKVQGDERDTIVISTTYGPKEPGGEISLNLGPIKDPGGERRLNVLFTRARHAIELVTSMQSHQIRPRPTSREGIHALRDFLSYVEARSLDADGGSCREPETPMERVICEALRANGHRLDCHVGVANYFIDLAVRHPKHPETYLLAIECDGPTYHAARAARDRDKYRQNVLEGLGWRVARIWSADWSANPDHETQKLLEQLSNQLAESATQAVMAPEAVPAETDQSILLADDPSLSETAEVEIAEAGEVDTTTEWTHRTAKDWSQSLIDQSAEEEQEDDDTESEADLEPDDSEDEEPTETWDDIPLEETTWDASDHPDYPWIEELDRRVHLSYDERLSVIAAIARGDRSVEEWIEELLHQQQEPESISSLLKEPSFEDLLDELTGGATWTTDNRNEDHRPVRTVQLHAPVESAQTQSEKVTDGPTAEPEEPEAVRDQQPSEKEADDLLLDDWQGSFSDQALVNLAKRFVAASTVAAAASSGTQKLIAGLLTFHIRENTAEAKAYKEHLAMNSESLYKDSDCIASAVLEETGHYKNDKHYACYRFDARQPFRFSKKKNNTIRLACLSSRTNLELIDVEATEGMITLAVNTRDINRLAEQTDLIHIPQDFSSGVRQYLAEQAVRWLEDVDSLPATIRHLFSQSESEQIRRLVEQANREPDRKAQLLSDFIFDSEGTSLILQGPPGSGKTTCAADVIATLVVSGCNVGVCANSHLAIDNLLVKTSEIARARDWPMSIAKFQSKTTREEREMFSANQIQVINNNTFHRLHDVYGGTVFALSHPRFEGLLDLLVIDEASQVPLANLLSMARCTRNLLLVGDQQQLPQPVVAEHPGKSGLSCLSFATAGEEVIPDTKGLFLNTSWRMTPDLCGLVSGTFYQDRLRSHPGNRVNRILWDGPASGLFFQAVDHTDSNVYSTAEADAIAELTTRLLGSTFIRNVNGTEQSAPVSWEDIAVMAPFNAQVSLLERMLGDKARVGTVDRFQGQEAPIAIYSITSSSLLSPRALEFALNANRVNVAISRAQCLAIVVGSPAIAELLHSAGHLINEHELFERLSAQHLPPASST